MQFELTRPFWAYDAQPSLQWITGIGIIGAVLLAVCAFLTLAGQLTDSLRPAFGFPLMLGFLLLMPFAHIALCVALGVGLVALAYIWAKDMVKVINSIDDALPLTVTKSSSTPGDRGLSRAEGPHPT